MHRFNANDKMSDVISKDYTLLQVLSRFEIPLGFGDASIKDVCKKHNIDTDTFISIISFMSSPDNYHINDNQLDITTLLIYLQQAHNYFLDFSLPLIRQKLLQAIDYSLENKIAFLIIQFFDEYVNAVRAHMEYENKVIFPHINDLISKNSKTKKTIISKFSQSHKEHDGDLDLKISELKNLIIKYYPAKTHNNLLSSVLFDIYSCEQEITMHCKLEDYLLVPAVQKIEQAYE